MGFIRILGYTAVIQTVEQRGVNFALTPAVEAQIRKFALPDTVSALTTAIRNKYRPSRTSGKEQQGLSRTVRPGRYAGGALVGIAGKMHYERRSDIFILNGTQYRMDNAVGSYSYDPNTRTLRWLTGPLAGRGWTAEYIPHGYENGPTNDRHLMEGDTLTLKNGRNQTLYDLKRI